MLTHYTVRKELEVPEARTTPHIGPLSPLAHLRKDAPPLILITGQRELEAAGRYEENALLHAYLKQKGHPEVLLYELDGYNHGNMPEGGFPIVRRHLEKVLKKK